MGEFQSVVKDAGYSLDPSEKAAERPPEPVIDLTGFGAQFEPQKEPRSISAEFIDDLELWIRRNRVTYPGKRHLFLPIDQLEKCMTPGNIRHELQRAGGCHDIRGTTLLLCKRDRESRQRIFAILCMLGVSSEITGFVREGILDTDLPFAFKDDAMYWKANQQVPEHTTRIDLFQGSAWSPLLRESFDEYQGQIAAPIFKFSWLATEKVKHFDLKSELVLPFRHIADPKLDELVTIQCEGGTSVVHKIKIHPAHFNAPKHLVSPSAPRIAF